MQRHRNPANGYRSNPMGIGGGGGGGVGQGYRNYNRGGGGGFGRGQPPQPRRIDVFMEAGKLASEYLFAKGLIPPSSGSGKWQMKNQIGGGEGEGSGVKRKLSDDFGSEMGGGDGDRAVRRSVKDPRLEKAKGALEKQGDGDSASGSMEEQRSGKDGAGLQEKSVSGDLELKSYDAGKVETTTVDQMDQSPEENSRVMTPVLDVLPKESVECEETSDGKKVDMSTDDVIMDDAKQESEETVVVKEDEPEENDTDTGNENSSDLLTLIRSDKVPTRTRSSVTLKGSKSDPVLICGDENKNKSPDSGVPDNPISLQDDKNQGLNKEPKFEETVSEQDQKYKFGQGLHLRSQSFPQRYSISEQDLNDIQHGYSRSSSDVLSRVEKQPLQINDSAELTKKPQEWTPANPHSNDYLHLSNSRGDQSSSQVGGSVKTEPCNDFAEEKQLFPNSFKICDLNLMGASDANEHRDTKPVMGFSSIGQTKQEPVSVDFDLTMNSNYGIAERHFRRGADGKGVEIIDLDCDSVQDDNNNPERRDEAIFTDLGSFPDSMQRVSDMPQDGYGLMISELLEADIPNSTVSSDVNSMHNEMSLQNEDGILADDESIYMSLGEIPISFVPVWDQQPSQGYNKRY
uniref:uncharacterized protein At4g26450 n=1 Tax=Erigeron canadensis TaxID=72917 RepID=UPI001CB8E577|nr:uncharacterized protein At4g26450 [Erigeron canadensis]